MAHESKLQVRNPQMEEEPQLVMWQVTTHQFPFQFNIHVPGAGTGQPTRKEGMKGLTAHHHTYRFSSSSLTCFLCEQGWLPPLELCLASVSWTCSRRGHLRCWWLGVCFDLVSYRLLIDLCLLLVVQGKVKSLWPSC